MINFGYVSIDKPQNKYYRSEPIRDFDVNKTMYQQIRDVNQENLNIDAIGYMGNYVKYKELLKRVDKIAAAYKFIGVKEDDVVPICTINTPEVAEILLALNKIGAVSKWVDLRSTDEQLVKYLTENDSKVFVGLNMLMPRVEQIIKNTDIEKVVSISPTDSVNPFRTLLRSRKEFKKLLEAGKESKKEAPIILPDDSHFVAYNDFSKLGSDFKLVKSVSFDKERPTLIVQSSGTTGLAKSIVHTDFSVNSSINNLSYSDLPFYVGNTLLTTVPPWVAYGLINSLYLSLAFGMKAELCPKVDGDVVFNNLGKYDLAFAAPLHYRYIADRIEDVNKDDLKRIKCLITGGDKIDEKELAELESLLGKKIYNGYGSNEVLGAGSVNPYNANHHGTVGIPLHGNEIVAFDVNTGDELPYNEQGELCIKTDTMFKEYFNKPDETKQVKKIHRDGSVWVHTGDLGYVDEEGFVHVCGRLKRVIIRKAFKIYPGTIEEVILSHPAVKECVVIGVNDKEDGQTPMAHIVLKNDYLDSVSQIEEELGHKCSVELKDYEQPRYINFIDNIPYTPNNKQDFRKLEDLGNDIVKNQNVKHLKLVRK